MSDTHDIPKDIPKDVESRPSAGPKGCCPNNNPIDVQSSEDSPQDTTADSEVSKDVRCLESLDVTASHALGFSSDLTMHSQTSTPFSSVEDLEKGHGMAIVDQNILGAHQPTSSGLTLVQEEQDPSVTSTKEDKEVLRALPLKRSGLAWRQIRHRLVAVYQRLFSIVVLGNLVALITLLCQNKGQKPFGPSLANVSTAVAANVTVAILMRQEYVINALYDICCWTPLWVPLRARRVVAKLYHFGGIHSGCAIAATGWFALYTGLLTNQFVTGDFREIGPLVTTYLLLVLLVSVCVFALPKFRRIFHNAFESVHRFGGWTAVGLFWIEVFLVSHGETKKVGSPTLGKIILRSPSFWFLCIITACIIIPWLRLRKVPVRAEILSSHALRLHLTHIKKGGPVIGIRLSTSPLREWHSFALIPTRNEDSLSVIISAAGDWTRRQIENPQASYWVRGIPIRGVLRMAAVFKKVVVVGTGSGIGPVLSMLNCSHRMPSAHILWSAPDPLKTFGQDIMDQVTAADQDAVVWNTREKGRPDMVALTYHAYAESGAEAVFIVSNPVLTRKVVYAMESRGIPAYGPIWDS